MIKIIIADDDPYARIIMRTELNNIPGNIIIGEAENGRELVQMAKELNPDVVITDIDMPEMNGLDATKEIFNLYPKTLIIFATAYDNFARDAFQVYAFDYLIKPFNTERIKQTIQRIQDLNTKRENSVILELPQKSGGENFKLFVQSNDNSLFVEIQDIIMITRYEQRTIIYTTEETITTYEPLKSIANRLNNNRFFRSHKGYLINVEKVKEISPLGNKAYQVKLANINEKALMTLEKLKEYREKYCV